MKPMLAVLALIVAVQTHSQNKIMVTAHRGDWHNEPENSLRAFQSAAAMGVDVIELDLEMSKDGQIVILHDHTLNRTTTGKGKPGEFTLAELMQFRLKNAIGVPTVNQIPTLKEVMLALKGKPVLVNLDHAFPFFRQAYAILQETGTVDMGLFKAEESFDTLKAHYPELIGKIKYMPIVDLDSSYARPFIDDYMAHMKLYAFEWIFKKDTSRLLIDNAFIREKGIRIMINALWSDLNGGHNDETSVEGHNPQAGWGWLIDHGATILQTDRPQLLLAYLRGAGLTQSKPLNDPFRSAVAEGWRPLYQDSIPDLIVDTPWHIDPRLTDDQKPLGDPTHPALEVFRPAPGQSNGAAMVIFPGGAYGFWAWESEGTNMAKSFAAKGFTCFIVKYRLPNRQLYRHTERVPLEDAEAAVRWVRAHASEYQIHTSEVGAIGFSAGGHVVSTLGTHAPDDARPNFMILVYPVITMQPALTHMGSRTNLLGPTPSKKEIDFYSNELQVTDKTPPTYLTHTGDDGLVPVQNSIMMYEALQRHHINAELHLYPTGNHGFILSQPVPVWLDPMMDWMQRSHFFTTN